MYKFDTHVHTIETSICGHIKGEQLVNLYKNAGYAGVVITDHFHREYFDKLSNMSWRDKIDCYLTGYRAAFKEGKRIGLNVILGIELRFDEMPDDYLVYGVDEKFLKEVTEPYSLSLGKFRDIAHEQGAIVVQAHPYRDGATPYNPLLLDGVEIFNPNQRHDNKDPLAYLLAKQYNFIMTSGSDCHRLEDLGKAGMIISENTSTSEEFVDVLKNNRVLELIGENELKALSDKINY